VLPCCCALVQLAFSGCQHRNSRGVALHNVGIQLSKVVRGAGAEVGDVRAATIKELKRGSLGGAHKQPEMAKIDC